MSNLTAEKAKKLANDYKPKTDIHLYIDFIDKQIETKARYLGSKFYECPKHQNSMYFANHGLPMPNDLQWKNIEQHYKDNGFYVHFNLTFDSLIIKWE